MPLALKPHSKILICLTIAVLLVASFAPITGKAQTTSGTGGTPPSTQTSGDQSQKATAGTDQNNFCSDLPSCISGLVYIIPAISADIAFVAAFFFDVIAQLTLSSSGYAIDFLKIGWQSALSIANIAFLFILIYIAITIMFEAETAGTLKMLATLIVMALLVNFSFFITRVVIDGGNILAVQFYNNIDAKPFAQESGAGKNTSNIITGTFGITNQSVLANTRDLTEPIMNIINIQGVWGTQTFEQWRDNLGASVGGWMYEIITLSFIFILVAVIYWILIFAFMAAGVKFMTRTIVLWFVIMLSPLAFAARALLKNNAATKLYDDWQKNLVQFTIYPAIFFFIYYFIYVTVDNLLCINPTQQCNGIAGLLSTNGQAQSLFITLASITVRMGIVIAMLYFGLRIADSVAGKGNSVFTSLTQSASKKVGSFVSDRANKARGLAYQKTVGVAGERLDKKLEASRFGNTPLGYNIRKKVAQPIANKNVGGAESRTQFVSRVRKEEKEMKTNMRDIDNRDAVKRAAQAIKENRDPDQKDIDTIKNFNKRELGSVGAKDLLPIAHILDRPQVEKHIKDNDNFSEEDQEKIVKAWNAREMQLSQTNIDDIYKDLEKKRAEQAQQRKEEDGKRTTEDEVRAREDALRAKERQLGSPEEIKQRWAVVDQRRQEEDVRRAEEDQRRTKEDTENALREQYLKSHPLNTIAYGSPEAPINQADKLIQKIGDLQEGLGSKLKEIPLEIRNGNRVSSKTIAEALTKLQGSVGEFRATLDLAKKSGNKEAIIAADKDIFQANELRDHLKKLQETIEKIPSHVSPFSGTEMDHELEIIKK